MIIRNVLANGVRVLAENNPTTLAATITINVKTGSRNETERITGLSHFLEHMAFKGTKRRPNAAEIARALDGLGAAYNAETDKETTAYYAKFAAEHFALMADILSDITFSSVYDPAELEKEKGTIIEEINMYEDTPIDNVDDLFEEILFADRYLGQAIIGTKENIRAMTDQVMRQYFDKFYRAGNVVVSVAGNLPKDYLAILEKNLGALNGDEVAFPAKKENKLAAQNVFVKNKKTEQTHLILGVPGLAFSDPAKYAAKVLAVALGGNMSSRLFTEIREKRGLAYYIQALARENSDAGTFKIRAGLNTARVPEAIKIICAEMAKIAGDITEAEITRAKEFIKGINALHGEDSEVLADLNAKQEIHHQPPQTLKERMALVDEVTKDQVRAVAARLFAQEKKLALIGPFPDEVQFIKIIEDN